jgi:hypothetical protein
VSAVRISASFATAPCSTFATGPLGPAAQGSRRLHAILLLGRQTPLAVVLTISRCSGDGSFDPLASPSHSSSYCTILHFPSLPNSAGGILLSIGLFLLPTLAAAAGTVRADRSGTPRPLLFPALVALGIVMASFTLVPAAHVTFVPAG